MTLQLYVVTAVLNLSHNIRDWPWVEISLVLVLDSKTKSGATAINSLSELYEVIRCSKSKYKNAKINKKCFFSFGKNNEEI